jgi:hypothetical protein
VHQAKTATAIRRSLRAAKAAQANGIAVDRIEYVLPEREPADHLPEAE